MWRLPAIVFLFCLTGSGCLSLTSETSGEGWSYATYDDLLGAIEDHSNDCPKRAEELRNAYLGKPVVEVKKDLERRGFDWSLFRPDSVALRDVLTHSLSKGIAWCERTRESDQFLIREEMILVHYENGIVTRLAVCWCGEGLVVFPFIPLLFP